MNPPIMASGLWTWPAQRLPRILSAGRYALSDMDFRHVYCSPDSVAVHLYDYHARLRIAADEFAIAPDVLTISPAAGETRYHLDVPGNHWCVHFLPAIAEAPVLALPLVQRLGARAAYTRERFARIALLFDRALPPEHPRQLAAGAALLELLCWLTATPAEAQTPAIARSDRAVEHAAELLCGDFIREWTVPGLARTVGLSPNYLAARFRVRFGMTIARYRLVQRVHEARIMLAGSDVPVGEVARRIGLPDPHHFNKLFRRIAGMPPSAARRKDEGRR